MADQKQLKILVLGDQGVGKTSFLDQFNNKKFNKNNKTTIGADFLKKKLELDDGRIANLQMWDTAGQERFQALCASFYRGSDCCVIVYDVNNPTSYQHIMQWRKAFLNAGNEEGIPFVIIGNKIDLPTNVAESLV